MYFDFKFSDGHIIFGQFEWVGHHYALENKVEIVEKEPVGSRSNRPKVGNKPVRVRDTFQPGWQPMLNQYVDSVQEYRKICKQKGMKEIGNEKVEPPKKKHKNTYFSDDKLKEYKQAGAQFSDVEAEVMKADEKVGKLDRFVKPI